MLSYNTVVGSGGLLLGTGGSRHVKVEIKINIGKKKKRLATPALYKENGLRVLPARHSI